MSDDKEQAIEYWKERQKQEGIQGDVQLVYLPCGFPRTNTPTADLLKHYGTCPHSHCKGLLKVWQHLSNDLLERKGIDLYELTGLR